MGCNSKTVANGISSFCTWGAFGLLMAAVSGQEWIIRTGLRISIWKVCPSGVGPCVEIPSEPWLNATRAFLILSIMITVIGNICYTYGFFKNCSQAGDAGYGMIYFAALCATIGAAVYTGFQAQNVKGDVSWGYCYALAWASVGLLNIGGGAAHASMVLQKKDSL